MKLKSFISCIVLTSMMMVTATPAAYALNVDAKNQSYALAPLTDMPYQPIIGTQTSLKAGSAIGNMKVTSFNDLCTVFMNPTSNTALSTYYDKRGEGKKCIFSDKTSFAFVISDNTVDSHDVESKLVVKDRSAQIGTADIYKPVTFNFKGGLSVENGNLLFQNSYVSRGTVTPDTKNQSINVVLGEPIEVKNKGRLILDSTSYHPIGDEEFDFPNPSTLTATNGKSAIVVENGGTADIAYFNVTRDSQDTTENNTPLIDVKEGATVKIFISNTNGSTDENGMPNYDLDSKFEYAAAKIDLDNGNSTAPAVSVANGATVSVDGGDLSSGNQPVFALSDGATLQLHRGTISNTSDQPAITVANGATIEIPTDSTASITTNQDGTAAIDLADGAIIKKDNTTITVGTNTADDGTNDNYVDNAGNIILAAGANKGDADMNAAVVLPDGTLIQGSNTEAPKVETTDDGNTTVTVPTGGSVTDKDGTTTPMPNGGNVTENTDGTTTITPSEKPVTGITLNKNAITLYSNTTPNEEQLIATVTPDDATDKTVTWQSSDNNVATVDESGLVKAIANGTATITAKAGNQQATCTVTVTSKSTGGGTVVKRYDVTLADTDNGSITATHKRASKNSTVTITATPDEGYVVDAVTVTEKDGDKVDVTKKDDNKYTFKMPASDVTVKATFKVAPTEPEQPSGLPFIDVAKDAWYFPAVEYVFNNGLMNGTTATTFAPNVELNRAMMAAVLYNMEGKPACDKSGIFSDVENGKWYTEAINWAASNNIVSGMPDGTYAPNQALTREQMASVLYRYAEYKGIDVSSRADLSTFTDGTTVSPWAQDVVQWAVAEKLMSGNGNALQPKGTASRAQVATVLMNYCENVAK